MVYCKKIWDFEFFSKMVNKKKKQVRHANFQKTKQY